MPSGVRCRTAPWRRRGFTLVEIAVVLAISGLLASAAWGSWRGHLRRVQRVEAATALHRLERAQVAHFARFGRYADALDELPGGPPAIAAQGHFRLTLRSDAGDGYLATAATVDVAPGDGDCGVLELRVRGVITEQLPSARCWLP
jgi:type IV pilus assembly protein PilE